MCAEQLSACGLDRIQVSSLNQIRVAADFLVVVSKVVKIRSLVDAPLRREYRMGFCLFLFF